MVTTCAGQDVASGLRQLRDPYAVARALQDVVGDDRGGLGEVQAQSATLPPAREFRGVGQQQSLLFVRSETHRLPPVCPSSARS